MMRTGTIVLCCSILQLPACESEVGGRGYVVRDSADLEIVDNMRPAWGVGEGWVVEPYPDLDVSGQEDDELHNPRDPLLLDDGRLVFYNGGTCEVRIYDDTPALLSAWGGCGEGPGEFTVFGGIWSWTGDSLLVVDQLPARVSVFDSHGGLGRTALVPTLDEMPIPFVLGVFGDGTLVTSGLRDPAGRSSPGIEAGRRSVALVQDWASPQLLGMFPGPVWEYTEWNGRVGRGRFAFSSATEFTVDRRRLFAGFPDRYEIRVFRTDGTAERIIRRRFESIRVAQRDIDWLLERRLNEVEGSENEQIVRRAFRDLQYADVMPSFGVPTWPGGADGGPSLLADAGGNLWVFDHYRPGEYRNRWTLFSPEGVWLGGVSLPDHLVPTHIGPDFVLGLWTDDEGFVHIRRHRINKT
jgi:hypothetical protein